MLVYCEFSHISEAESLEVHCCWKSSGLALAGRGKKGCCVTVKMPWNSLRKSFLLDTAADRTNLKWSNHHIYWKSL